MLTMICGPSGSGKSTIAKALQENYDYKNILLYTTRQKRPEELNGVDYYFVDSVTFEKMNANNELLNVDRYSNNRNYALRKKDIDYAAKSKDNYVLVLTPSGIREISKYLDYKNINTIYISADIGVRVKRYIDRLGEHNFTLDDLNEIATRSNSDFGKFTGIEKEIDYIFDNSNTLTNEEFKQFLEKIHSQITLDMPYQYEIENERPLF